MTKKTFSSLVRDVNLLARKSEDVSSGGGGVKMTLSSLVHRQLISACENIINAT